MAKDNKTTGKAGNAVKNKTDSVRKPSLDEVLTFAEGDANTASAAQSPAASADKAEPAGATVMQQGISARSLMPTSERDRAILKQRAATLAGEEDDEQYSEQSEEYLRLRLGKTEEYGIPYQYLDEILYVSAITEVPCTPAYIAGVANRRGEMLTVLDLQPFFNIQRDAIGEAARIIVVSGNGMRLGILIDEVISNDHYDPQQLAPPMVSSGVKNLDLVKGIYNGKVTMLNLESMLSEQVLAVNELV